MSDSARNTDVLGLEVNLTVEVHDAETGELLRRQQVHNRVPLTTRNVIRDLLNGGAYTTSLNAGYFAVGTGVVDPADADTALGAEVFRDVVTSRSVDVGTINVQYYLDTTSANGSSLTEAGLFNAAAGPTLLARATFDPIVKTTAVTVTFSWDIAINAG